MVLYAYALTLPFLTIKPLRASVVSYTHLIEWFSVVVPKDHAWLSAAIPDDVGSPIMSSRTHWCLVVDQ